MSGGGGSEHNFGVDMTGTSNGAGAARLPANGLLMMSASSPGSAGGVGRSGPMGCTSSGTSNFATAGQGHRQGGGSGFAAAAASSAVDSSGACGEAVGGSNGGLSSPSRRGVTFGFGGSGSGGRRKPTTSAAAVAALAVAGSFELGDPIAHWFPGCKREFLMDDAEDEDDVAMDVFKRSRFN